MKCIPFLFGPEYSTYTNSYGYYEIEVPYTFLVFGGGYLNVCAENIDVRVLNNKKMLYQYRYPIKNYDANIQFNHVFTDDNDGVFNKVMQIFSALYNYSNYAKSLLNQNYDKY